MPVNRIYFLLIAIILVNTEIFSQYNANSPYSRYGVGDMDQSGFGHNRALGGLSICLRQPNQINFLNPASYNSQDSMSFIWDIGLFANFATSSTNNAKTKRRSTNFDHLALSFPASKGYYISAGLVPFSNMGYNINEITLSIDSLEQTHNLYVGTGNLNQFYFGNAFGLFRKHLNFGFNISYIFGSLNTNNSTIFYKYSSSAYSYIKDTHQPGTSIEKKIMAGGLYLNFGLQSILELNKDNKFIIGLTCNPKTKINVDYSDYIIRDILENDTIYKTDTSGYITIPLRLGFGLCFKLKDKLLIGTDFTMQDWRNSSFPGKNDSLLTDSRISFGVQYTPNSESYRSYFQKIDYRIGGYYNNTYLKLRGVPIKDYGISLGLGLPLRNLKTKFNITFEMGRHGTKSNNLVEINYSRITFSLSLYDSWFIKKKYD